jgi:hypothetical protein
LELAYRGYHTIPWERVHDSARKRVEILLNTINRDLPEAAHMFPGLDRIVVDFGTL